jgi:hypothetical protein
MGCDPSHKVLSMGTVLHFHAWKRARVDDTKKLINQRELSPWVVGWFDRMSLLW